MKEIEVAGFADQNMGGNPELLLKAIDGSFSFSMWIGAVEAAEISLVLTQTPTPRPFAHELLLNTVAAWDKSVSLVEIVEVRDSIFYADVVFDDGTRISCRPSDGIVIALRAGVPLGISASVEEFVRSNSEQIVDTPADEIDEFRKFLDSISPDDFV